MFRDKNSPVVGIRKLFAGVERELQGSYVRARSTSGITAFATSSGCCGFTRASTLLPM
jgi:hypothetical protein